LLNVLEKMNLQHSIKKSSRKSTHPDAMFRTWDGKNGVVEPGGNELVKDETAIGLHRVIEC
jgi:hypothetical protein